MAVIESASCGQPPDDADDAMNAESLAEPGGRETARVPVLLAREPGGRETARAPVLLAREPRLAMRATDAAVEREHRIERMVQVHFDAIWRCLRRLGVEGSALDDAAQQVFLVAARRIDEIEPSGEKSYLLGIAVRVASDARRTNARRREVADERPEDRTDPRPSPEELVDRKRARQMLDRILEAMPMDLRAAFTMFEIEGMTVPEVASALGIPLGTAASRLRRAREQFRELVSHHVRGGAGDV